MKTKPVTWFAFVLCVIAGVLILAMFDTDAPAAPRCKPIDPKALVLWLPEDGREAMSDFIAKAERLNASGQCVIEGGYGKSYGKFYFAIDKDGQPRNDYFVRFTRDELRK